MRATKMGFALASLVLLLGLATSSASAQARRGPPIIRIYSDNGVDYVGTSSYITPRIELSENAYVFAVEMDMDGQIQVLHPDFPGLSVRIAANKSLQLPNFFAGFSSSHYGGTAYDASYNGYNGYGNDDSRGTVIALASRAPFNLEKIESGGDWDISAIRRLIENRSPLDAAAVLAQYLGQAGEQIGRDYLRFDGGNHYGYPYYANAYDSYYSSCAGFYGYNVLPSYVLRQLQAFAVYTRLRGTGQGRALVGFDACGSPIFIGGGVINGGHQTPVGHFPPPRGHGDTTVFPKSRLPRTAPVPRGSGGTTVFANALDAGMPVTRQGALPRMGDVTVKASPTGRRGEPRVYLQDYNGGGMSAPLGRVPVERTIVPRGAVSGGGLQSVPTNRSEPRVESAPARMPERTSSPPPVIHERPSSPPPPPPRSEPSTRSDPPRQPPPSRGH
jgi:hypothetical protein